MCGLAAIFAYQNDGQRVERAELLQIREAMLARGPDGAGLWLSQDHVVGLAHRRLAILDLTECGSQPMFTPDGKLGIVFNGEIYNYRELRERLKVKGYSFHSDSDTEVLLYAYREYGQNMVHRLRGMFAFALWDEDQQGLFLARDHFGIKPLYYHDDGKTLRAASQIKALLAGGNIETQPEPAGRVGFYLWGCVPEPYTLYRNLFALPAGHSLWVDQCGPRAPHKYFDIAEEFEKATATKIERPAVEALQDALYDSVKHHLIADVPVGVFLSSGLDSATLTALASEQVKYIQSITLGFSEYAGTPADETPLARKIAAHYGCRHQVFQVDRSDFEEDLPAILHAMDQPSIDGVNTWFVVRAAARTGLKVAISGLGADELLGGYPSFHDIPRLVPRARPVSLIPGLGKALRVVPSRILKRNTSPKYASLFEYGGSYGGAYLLRRGLFMPWELPAFLDGELVREGWETLEPILRLDAWVARVKSPHAKVATMELAFYMRNMLLRDSDWAGMAHSLEIRVPFVDIVVFRALAPYLVSATPPLKRDLVGTPQRSLPVEVVNRPKTGFSIPVKQWIETQGHAKEQRGLRGWAKYVSTQTSIKQTGEYRGKRIVALLSDAYGGRGGIAKFNRDLLWSICADPKVRQVVAVPRNMPDIPDGLPTKLRWVTSGLGGKSRYLHAVWQTVSGSPRSDLVLCGHINLLPIAWMAARIKNAPLWCVIHGIDAWKRNKSALVNHLLRNVDGVIAVSDLSRRRFSAWSGVLEAKIHLLPNCYDPALFFPAPRNKMLEGRYGLDGKTVLLTVGRLDSNERCKGFDEIIEILPALSREMPNITYLIVGEGNDRARLEEKAYALGVSERVVFTGYIDESEKAHYYRLADAYVMPSQGEGFGIVFLEALACGLPAIGSKIDGSREALADGRLGLLVDPGRPEEIRDAVRTVLKEAERKPPEGLMDFSLHRFKERAREIFEKAAQA